MAKFSVTYCKKMVDLYGTALERVLSGQSYTIGGRSLIRVNHAEILAGLKYWQDQLDRAEDDAAYGGRGVRMRRTICHG